MSLASRRPPPAHLVMSPTPPSCHFFHCPAFLTLSIIPLPRIIQHPLATQVIYLDLIVVFIIPVECGWDKGRADGLSGRFISGHPWNTMAITSMWTCQSSPPPTNLYIEMLGMVRVNCSRLFGVLASYFVFHDCASTKMATKKLMRSKYLLVSQILGSP